MELNSRRMLGVLFLTIALAVCAPARSQSFSYNPVADESAVVVCGNARFTVLTSRLVRMEWADDAAFEDRATLAVVNRHLEVPAFRVSRTRKGVTIRTKDLTLRYKGPGKFAEGNLCVEFTLNGKKVKWHPGADESGNLMGTFRTLDGCTGYSRINYKGDPYEQGILSRDGWALVDESKRHVLQPEDSDWGEWVEARPEGDRLDWYLFAYGHAYKDALADFARVAGRIPLPPKYVFGYWWSRYWQYSDFEFIGLAKEIRSHSIPMDVMVIDMDWHDTWTLMSRNSPKDEFGQRIGWTGYTWQKELFPDPARTLSQLHAMNLRTSLNLHPASGIQPYEDCYDRFVPDYLSRTTDYDGPKDYLSEDGKKRPVPFRMDQRAWADAYFNSVIHPLERMGVDFWWLDWQQWKESKYVEDLSNTFWLNYTFFNDKVRRSTSLSDERPLIYHRWGGLGSHRYQIGFSGDCYDTWDVLRFLPYFTATSSNVGYGYWGHDIGGHQSDGKPYYKPEIYTRWLQYGVFTPIFKTHSTKSALIERRIWTYAPEYAGPMREAVRLRYSLSPYIYTAARETFDTGVCLCRPLYYEYPEAAEAYSHPEEFFFGDDILATAVCEPVDTLTGLAPREIWFPAGNDWYDVATGCIYEGGQTRSLSYTLNENPWYVKAGAIIPMASEEIASLQEHNNLLRLLVAPGEGESKCSVYEDDGVSQAYEKAFARTWVTKRASAGNCTVTVAPREGTYEGMDPMRRLEFVLEGVWVPTEVTVNGAPATWHYEGKDLAVVVSVPEMSASEEVVLSCTFPEDAPVSLLRGKKGVFHRMMAYTPVLKDIFNTSVDLYKLLSRPFLRWAQCASHIDADPSRLKEYLEGLDLEAVRKDLTAEHLEAALATIEAQVAL